MGGAITLFSGYDRGENRTTNYTLLVLKSIYEENPKYLGELLDAVVGENMADLVGVKFKQQERHQASVPDGLILQHAFTVYIETKHWDWFYDDQLERHLDALNHEPGRKVLIALGNFESSGADRFQRVRDVCRQKYVGNIAFASVTFEDFVEALQGLDGLPKNLSDMIADFRSYLDEHKLLPSWERLLDVVNCAGLPDEVASGGVYMCPATAGAYSHSRSRFFGMYRNKRVERVAEILGVVDLESPDNATVRWRNAKETNEALIRVAREKLLRFRNAQYPTRVFVLGPLVETEFLKTTKGGMLQSKKYFDVSELEPKDAADLAAKLRGKTWPVGDWIVR